jgi:hypothetical protein
MMKEMDGVRGRGCCCFCDGDDNGYADTTAMATMIATIDYCLLVKNDGMIVAILYFFMFNENGRKNLLATKVMGGGRGKVG